MKILIVGGTRRVGPYLIEQLAKAGHSVVCFHRGKHNVAFSDRAEEILGDRRDVSRFKKQLAAVSADAVVDMMAGDNCDVRSVAEVFGGRISRYVCISSYEVYDAFEAAWDGRSSPQPTPIPEHAPKRKKLDLFEHKIDSFKHYDKILMETEVQASQEKGCFETTILRFPALYGPRDTTPRSWYYVKQALDGRCRIPVAAEGQALFSRGYLENMAHAIVLAVENPAAAGHVYNAADAYAVTSRQIIEMIGDILDHQWEIVSIPRKLMPAFTKSQGQPYSADPYDISPHLLMDLAKIKGELGYTDLVQNRPALERTVEWLCEHQPEEGPPFDYDVLDKTLDAFAGAMESIAPSLV